MQLRPLQQRLGLVDVRLRDVTRDAEDVPAVARARPVARELAAFLRPRGRGYYHGPVRGRNGGGNPRQVTDAWIF